MKPNYLVRYLQNNQKVALLGFVSAAAVALLIFRFMLTGIPDFIFLTWNLFLAWVPLFFIKWVWEQDKSKRLPLWLLTVYLSVWLLFFPNAPYIVTDLKHLKAVPESMLWYDAIMIFTFAVAGFLTGLYSIRIVFRILTSRWSHLLAWTSITSAMVLSAFGIFLGRYGRWNSWDVVTQPRALLHGIIHSIQDPFAIKHTLTFSFVLMLLYFAFHIFAELKRHESSHKYW